MASHYATQPEPVANPAQGHDREEGQKEPVTFGMWMGALSMLVAILDEVWRRSLVVQPAVAPHMRPRAAGQRPPGVLVV